MWFIGLVVGGFVGAALGSLVRHSFEWGVLGAFVGVIAGIMISARRSTATSQTLTHAQSSMTSMEARFAALEQRLGAVEAALARVGQHDVSAVGGQPGATSAPGARAEAPPVAASPAADGIRAAPPAVHPLPPVALPPAAARPVTAASPVVSPPVAPRAPNAIWAWLVGGNTPARVGIVVLLVGVAFLLKYASEHVSVPIAVRTSLVALGGVALLVLGWKLRVRRRLYAMILQGGGVGVLYLTVFAAFRLYALLPAPAAFALLVAIAALAAFLAVGQDAIGLAVASVFGGFLAPILASGETGSHVVLFSYYTLLNAAIFGIAWFKSWRPLNLLGFACTAIIATAWGVMRYHADDFATTEPFVVLFFLFYVGIAVLYALRRAVDLRRYVDGTLVFGTPLVAAAWQQALLRPYEFGMALSAVCAGAFYLVLARVLWARRHGELALLVESFLALGVVCATLAVPLAFDVRLTSAAWALEGAAIVWVGLRQQRALARAFGLLLELAASVAFALDGTSSMGAASGVLPIVNSDCIGALLVAAAALTSAFVYQRNADRVRPLERVVSPLLLAWGTLWWLAAGMHEIDRFVASAHVDAAFVGFAAMTAVLFATAAQRLAWPAARMPARLLGPVLLAGALIAIVSRDVAGGHLLADGGIIAWPVAIAIVAALNRHFERAGAFAPDSRALQYGHAVTVWLITVVVAEELGWLGAREATAAGVWRQVPWGLVPAAMLAAIDALVARGVAPFASHRRAYRIVAAVPLAFCMLAWTLLVGIAGNGDPDPLPYIPLVNPVDLTVGLIAATLVRWARNVDADQGGVRTRVPPAWRVGVPAVLGFLWLNAIALRTLHHWFGIGWSLHAIWRSTLAQSMLSILWTVIALAAMSVANRRASRSGWMAGAVLLAIVVGKLFLVDLSRIAGIERIVSFIGVGLLLLLIGYLAPVPPRRQEDFK